MVWRNRRALWGRRFCWCESVWSKLVGYCELGVQGGSFAAYPGTLLDPSSKMGVDGYFFIRSNDKLSRPLVIMSGKIKIGSDMMRCYDGTGDVVTWLKKKKN